MDTTVKTPQAVATVLFVEGQAFARDPLGGLRALKAGDVLLEGDTIVTMPGGQVQLAFLDGQLLNVLPNETFKFGAEVSTTTRPSVGEAALAPSDVERVIQALERGGDIDADLDPTAAGLDGGTNDAGNSFVRLMRVAEGVTGLEFQNPTQQVPVDFPTFEGGVTDNTTATVLTLGSGVPGPPPTIPAISINDVSVNEGAGTATFTVTLSNPSASTVSVNYATANGSATAGVGNDYTAVSGGLTFNPGVTSQTITVSILNDNLYEISENFQVNLTGATNATISDAQGIGTITDNDPIPTISSITSPTIGEGSNLVYTVNLTNASSTATTFAYTLGGGTASASDYGTPSFSNGVTLLGGILTVPANVTSFTVTLPTVQDTLDEANETVPLIIGGVTGTGTITDDDPTPSLSINSVTVDEGAGTATFTVTLSAASGQTVSVNFGTNNGTATAGSDFTTISGSLTFNPGVTSQTITVPILNDNIYEGSETFNVILSTPSNATIATGTGIGTIKDDGTGGPTPVDNDTPILTVSTQSVAENAGYAQFTVSLSNPSVFTTTLSLALTNGTATGGGVDFGSSLEVSTNGGSTWVAASSVTIPALQTSVLVRTPIINDTLNETNETFTLTATRTGGTPLLNVGGAATGTTTIIDDDPIPSLSINNVTVNEGAGTATFTVTLSAASGQTVNVNFNTSNGTATSGSDYTTTSGGLTFNPGVTSQTITVPVLNDAIYEGTETFNVTLASPTNATITTATGIGTIKDDGTGGPPGTDNDTPTLTVSSPTVAESGSYAQFTVSLSNQSTQTTTLNLALTNGTATGGGVDFGAGLEVSTNGGVTWVAASSVTIPALQSSVLVRTPVTNDVLVEGSENFTLTATRIAGTPVTNVGGAASGTGTITDNDTFSVSGITVDDDDVNENRDASGANDISYTGTISNVASTVVLSINDTVASGLTSNSQAISYSWNAGTRTLTASSASGTVFTVVLNATNDGYTFKQFLAIDHATVAGENHSLNIPLSLVARDSGGALITSSNIDITVFDDAPSVSGAKTILTDNDGNHSETGFLTQATLSNDITRVTWTTTGLPNLVFEGKPVLYVDNGSGTLTGQLADGTLIFRARIDTSTVNSDNNPQYTFELLNTLGRVGIAGSENSYTVISGGNANNLDLGFGGFLIDKMTAVAGTTTATVNTNNGWIGVAGNWFDPDDKLFMNFVDPSGQNGQVTGLNMLVEGQGSAAYTLNWTVTAAIDALGNTVTYSGSAAGAGNADLPFTIPLQNGALYFTKLEISSPAGSGDFRISFSTISANNYFADIALPLSYTLTDADNDTVNGAINITLDTNAPPLIDLDANDSSLATGTSYRATYTENGAAIPIADADISITDPDNTTLTGATIRLTNAQAGDVLAVGALPSGITATIDNSVAGQITVTLTGSSSLVNYQTAIRAVTYRSTSEDPSTVDRIVDVSVSDGKASATASTTISVVATNDLPINAVPVAQTITEDTTRVFSSVNGNAITVSDLDASSLTATLTVTNGILNLGSVAGVTVTGNGTGTVTVTGSQAAINAALNGTEFRPNTDFSGNALLTVSTTDGVATDIDTVSIAVTAVADTPTVYAHAALQGMVAGTSVFSANFNSGDLNAWSRVQLTGNTFAEIPGGNGKTSTEASLFGSVAWDGQTTATEFNNFWTRDSNTASYNVGGGGGSDDAQGMLAITTLTSAQRALTSYTVSSDIFADADSAQANGVGLVFGYVNATNYFLARWENPSADYAPAGSLFNSYPGQYQELSLVQIVGGVPIDLARTAFNGDDWFNLNINVNVNGITVTAVDASSGVTSNLNYTYGTVAGAATSSPALNTFGLYTFDNDSVVRWDNVAVNQGGTYTYILRTEAQLSDRDGSETLSNITLSGIPSGVTLFDLTTSSAVSVSGGNATVIPGNDIRMTTSAGLTTTQLNTIQASVTATETSNSSTASNASSVKFDMIGTSGADSINGSGGDDWISGGAGNDTLVGGSGRDVLIGGAGNDNLTGGLGSDVFRWQLADRGTAGSPAQDTIADFNTALPASGGDVLDLRDLLVGENNGGTEPGNLANFLSFEKSGTNTIVHVSSTGGFASGYAPGNEDQTITLSNVDLVTGFADSNAIITNLLTNNKLITD